MNEIPRISFTTKLIIILTNVFFLGFVLKTLKKKYMVSKFALPWIMLAVGNIIFTIFHRVVFKASSFLGFRLPVNFYFFVMNIFFMWRIFSLSEKAYKFEHFRKKTIQENSLKKNKKLATDEHRLNTNKE